MKMEFPCGLDKPLGFQQARSGSPSKTSGGKKFPLDQLLALLAAHGPFRYEVSIRVRMGDDFAQIELPGMSQGSELPRMSVDDLFAVINKSVLAASFETN